MDKVTFKAGNLEEAIEGAAQILGVSKDEIEHKVVSEGKAGVLGIIGGKDIEIEAWKKISPEARGQEIMQEILNYMGLLAVAEAKTGEDREVIVDIKGEDLGQIIGKDGATIDALQVLISAALSRAYGGRIRTYVDAGGYREKQKQAIERLALSAAKDVAASGQEKVLPPMSAGERRIVHMALKDDPKITTHR